MPNLEGVEKRSFDKLAWNDEFPPLNLWNYPMNFEHEVQKRVLQDAALHEKAVADKQEWLRKQQQIIGGYVIAQTGQVPNVSTAPEYTGGSVSYYQVFIKSPTTQGRGPYTAECNDIIEALGMNYAEGNAFKAIWRSCAARNLHIGKQGYKDGKYDAEKVVFFGQRMLESYK